MQRIRYGLSALAVMVLTALAPLAVADTAGQRLEPGDLVAVAGDSITEQILYSVDIESYLLMCQPVANVRARQFGVSGEQASGFLARLDNDVLPFHPNVVTTFYGMNDGGYAAITDAVRDRYYTNEKHVVEALKKGGVRWIIVGSPGCVDSDTYNKDKSRAVVYNQTLGALRDEGRKVAVEEGVSFVDVHEVMMKVMADAKKQFGPGYPVYGADGIHPWANGHLVIAYAFLKALGCDGNIGTIHVDLPAGTAEATDGHKIVSTHAGTIEVQSTRYPFCFFGDAVAPDGGQLNTRKIVACFPFNQELNRFILKVNTGADPGQRFRVEWLTPAQANSGGDVPTSATKVFTAGELAKGLNLAEQFMDNPFSAAFTRVHHLAQAQQEEERRVVRGFMEKLAPAKDATPEAAAARQAQLAGAVSRLGPPLEAAAAAVQPVRHVIRISRVEGAATPAPDSAK